MPRIEGLPRKSSRGGRHGKPILILGMAFLAACGPGRDRPAPDVEVVDLALRHPREGCIAGGETHGYRLVLDAGEFLQLVVDQRGADVVVTLLDELAESLQEVDGLTGAAGPERLLWLADSPGKYRVAVHMPEDGLRGCYSIEVRALRRATPRDRQRVAAANAYLAAGRLEDPLASVDAYRHVLQQWQELGQPEWQAETLHALGFVHRVRLRQLPEARDYYLRTLELLETVDNPVLEALISSNLGDVYDLLGEMDLALGYYRRALELRSRMDDPRQEARTLNDLGYVFAMLGEVHEALTCYDRALEKWRVVGDRSEEARTLHNRAKRYAQLGNYRQALEDFHQALELRQALDQPDEVVSTLSGIGQVYELSNQLEQALEFLERALTKCRQLDDRQAEALVLAKIGSVYDRLGRRSEARDALERALATFREIEDRRQQAIVLHKLGWHLDSGGEPDVALDHYRRALGLSRSLAARGTEAAVHLGMAHAERRRRRLLRAKDHVEDAVELIEDLRTEPGSQDLSTSYFATKQSYYGFYVDLLWELHRAEPLAGWARAALEVSERARARSLLDMLVEGRFDLRRGADPELLAAERRLARSINAREYQRSVRLSDTPDPEWLAEIDREIEALLREHDMVVGEIRKTSPSFAALTRPQTLGVAAIQSRVVDRETVLLEFDVNEERSFLWWVTKDSVSSFELPGRAAIEKTARLAWDLATVSHQSRFKARSSQALEDLSEMLLAPVADLLRDQRLLVVGEDVLNYVPFAALPKPASGSGEDARPLIADHEIVTMPSASALAVLRAQLAGRRPAEGLLAVVADPVFSSQDPRVGQAPIDSGEGGRARALEGSPFERLAFTDLEARSILAAVPAGEGSFQALAFDASRDTVVSGRLADYRIVHIATHGRLNAEQPELSGLVFSLVDPQGRPQDGFLHAHEIYELDLAADLVVLSACQTALGREIQGEGLVGLTQGFMYAGAAQVLVSLWNVNDRATAELMESFYQAMFVRGLPPSAALRVAQNAMRQRPSRGAPFYWAGFVLQGDWRTAGFAEELNKY